jgi:predicted dehydrogenase
VNFLIIGVGLIAQEYAKILASQKIPFVMVGRNKEKAEKLAKEFQYDVFAGGAENYLATTSQQFDCAINAADTESLYLINRALLLSGKVKKILTEKPGAFTEIEFKELFELSKTSGVPLFIAYNRRNFSSVQKLKEILSVEKNTSLFFEFTEWFWRINPKDYSENTIKEWILCNSSHVLDLAFYLGNGVKDISCSSVKTNKNEVNNSQYVGHGVMNNGALFSYIADWESAGRWKVEASTTNGRYMLCPLEKLFFQKRGTLEYVEVPFDTALDQKFKPGFYKQVMDLMATGKPNLKSIEEQLEHYYLYQKMKG